MITSRMVPSLSNGGAKALKDTVSQTKSITALLQKSLGQIKSDLIPSIVEDMKNLDSQIDKLTNEVNDLKEENGSILGTLQVQDNDLTILEACPAKVELLLEEQEENGNEGGRYGTLLTAIQFEKVSNHWLKNLIQLL
jgi:hypothetical protein